MVPLFGVERIGANAKWDRMDRDKTTKCQEKREESHFGGKRTVTASRIGNCAEGGEKVIAGSILTVVETHRKA